MVPNRGVNLKPLHKNAAACEGFASKVSGRRLLIDASVDRAVNTLKVA